MKKSKGETMKDFKDKVAVITGGASGIGRGIAEHCAREGMKVVLADIEEAALRDAERALKAAGARVLAVHTDVSKVGDIETLARKTLDAFRAVHLLFNNAGVQTRQKTWEASLADWEWVINVNLWGVINGIRIFAPIMLQQQTDCHIVNTASIAGLTFGPEIGIYRVTKHAVVSLSESLYFELRQQGARMGVSVLCPIVVRSRLNEAARNRPSELLNPIGKVPPTPEEQALEERFRAMNESGMSPEEYSEQVFRGITEDKFYILTSQDWNPVIRQRMEAILNGRNPEFPEVPRR
jgi:NAD(P)-dependent dehydrogenase (short-subunit alcohol dehydrogenase family)